MSKFDFKSQKPFAVSDILDALQSGSTERVAEIYRDVHPGDIERAFERLDEDDRVSILEELPDDVLAEWSDYLTPAELTAFLHRVAKPKQKETLDSLSDDELVDFLQEVDDINERDEYIQLLEDEKRIVSEELLQYPDESAGGRMTTMMASVNESVTVKEALDQLKALSEEAEMLSRIYVINNDDQLVGRIRLRDLAFAKWETPISEVMSYDQISISAHSDQEEAAQMISRYDLLALPVVDEDKRLLGVITYDDAMEIIEEESTEDIERQSGIGGERGDLAYLQTPVLAHFRRRFVWVVVLAFLALLSGLVLMKYEDIMKNFYILALYLPMVVAAGGNTGAQSATMVIRAMALGELGPAQFVKVIWKELRVGAILGTLLGIIVALQINFLLPASATAGVGIYETAMVVGFALTAQIFTSTLIGAALPLLARMAKLDPAVVASPAITTLVDVSGSVIYFTLARIIFS
ncbi:MAG: magnesium transporter [Verrucomicrobiales bacterium]|nr:magnesium transporter [Verrucomicrobiales bacterium]